MGNLREFLSQFKNKTLLAVFPHPDDESYVSGVLFQVAKRLNLKTVVICLSKETSEKELELRSASNILGIEKAILWDFPKGKLFEKKIDWVPKIKAEIERLKPSIVLTFDPSGITGHPDHTVVSLEILNLLKKEKVTPTLLWRVPDQKEKVYFSKNPLMKFSQKADYELGYSLSESIKKIRAIFCYKTKLVSFFYKLHLIDWFLIDHKETYHVADLRKEYFYRLAK